MNILIVDDEPPAIKLLENYILKVPGLLIAGKCANALEALYIINNHQIDAVYLDINMPEITGIAFLKMLRNPPAVVFTTAYTQYAAESYNLNVVDYLVKPISFDRFLKSVDKLKKMSASEAVEKKEEETIFVRADGKNIKIELRRLYLVEGYKNYVLLWTDNGRLIVHSTMKSFEKSLENNPNFLRVHKSYLVNLKHITEMSGNYIKVNEKSVPIGATYLGAIRAVLNR